MTPATDNPFERTEECPVRMTSIVGYDSGEVYKAAQRLIDNFGWKYHSVAVLQKVDQAIVSVLLWNTK